METQNYIPGLSYFAIKYEGHKNDLICCYSIEQRKLENNAPYLRSLHRKNWRAKTVKNFLSSMGAKQNDFYDEKNSLLYPGQIAVSHANELTNVRFYKAGQKNNPVDNFPANIYFIDGINFQFYNNDKKQPVSAFAPYYQNTTDIIMPEYNPTYRNLVNFANNPYSLITFPDLDKRHSFEVLKFR